MTWSVALGFAIAASTRVGNLLGAGRPKQAKKAAWTFIVSIGGIMATLCAGLLIAGSSLGLLYTQDAEVLKIVGQLVPLLATFLTLDAMQVGG